MQKPRDAFVTITTQLFPLTLSLSLPIHTLRHACAATCRPLVTEQGMVRHGPDGPVVARASCLCRLRAAGPEQVAEQVALRYVTPH